MMKTHLLGLILLMLIGYGVPVLDDLNPGYWERTPLPQTGLATFYAPGLMDWVQLYRSRRGQLPECLECVGAVALLRAGDIGRKVWLQPQSGELAGPFLVVDCAHPDDIPPLLERQWVVDISYDLGQLWQMNRPLDGVTVWADPAEDNPQSGSLPPIYIDPKDVVISAPSPPPDTTATPVPSFPTRLPEPLAPRPASPAPAPVRLTPLVTTPTPPGAQANSGPATGVPAAPPSAEPVTPANVSLGRPGVQLLPEQPWRTVSPVKTPTARPRVTAGVTSPPILPAGPATRVPDSGKVQASILDRLWRLLHDLLAR